MVGKVFSLRYYFNINLDGEGVVDDQLAILQKSKYFCQ